MEGFDFDNMLGENEIMGLFDEAEQPATTEEVTEEPEQKVETSEDGKDKNTDTEEKTTEVVNPDDLFGDEGTKQPESVGSEKNNKETGDTTTDDGGTSPENFYSSIANAMAVDGIFPNLDEETISKVDSAEGLSDLIEAEVNARLDETQLRVKKALENGVEPEDIRRYEGVLQQISHITDQQIADESEKGEQLRRNLIYQDYLNKGISPAKAQKMTERSIEAGTDVEDAKEALQSNKEYFQGKYNQILEDAQSKAEADKAEQKKQAEKLKDSIFKDKQLLGDLEIAADVRKKVYENISKPTYKDPDTGEYLTSIQKYEMEHRPEFLKYVGLFFTLTNGFKDFDSFIKGKVRKETRKGLSELEKTLNSTRRDSNGNLKMVTNVKEDPESFFGGNFKLAL